MGDLDGMGIEEERNPEEWGEQAHDMIDPDSVRDTFPQVFGEFSAALNPDKEHMEADWEIIRVLEDCGFDEKRACKNLRAMRKVSAGALWPFPNLCLRYTHLAP
jgi:hypothetical protein